MPHINPDPDCLGSAFTLLTALRQLGAESFIFRIKLPSRLAWMTEGLPESPWSDDPRDMTAVSVDVAARRLLPFAGPIHAAVDHHFSHEPFADMVWVEGAAACTLLIQQLCEKLGVPLSPRMAGWVYAGLWADTAGMSNRGATAAAFAQAAELVRAGAANVLIATRLERRSDGFRRIVYELSAARREVGQFAVYVLPSELRSLVEPAELALLPDDLLDEAPLAVLYPTGDDMTTICLRSCGDPDISGIARLLGGGGHPHRATAVVREDLQTTLKRVIALMRQKHDSPK